MKPMEARNLTWVGIVTWIVVAIPSVSWEVQHDALLTPRGIGWLLLFVGFGAAFALCTSASITRERKIVLLVVQTVCALGGMVVQPGLADKFQPILLVIIAGQLGGVPRAMAIAWITVQTSIYGVIIFRQVGAAPALVLEIVAVYAAFQFFAVVAIQIAHREHEARQQLAAANAELKVATGLLDLSSRTSERLRIARDLHDLLGHHLTALSINLEVASHLANGEAREPIEKSRSIAKHLLADVRDVVSRLRDDEPVDFGAALQSLRDVITTPSLHLDVAPNLAVRDSSTAQVALRAVQEIVTNAVRHSNARNLWLDIAQTNGTLAINARDDGEGVDHVQFGNGLRGMRERVEEAKGTMEIASMRGKGFAVVVQLPISD
jgi:signal transduction histidine kinase